MRPVQAAAVVGSQTSNLISESEDGRAVPCTRQSGTDTFAPPMVAGGLTTVADVIVDPSGTTLVKPAQLTAPYTVPDVATSPSASAAPMMAGCPLLEPVL